MTVEILEKIKKAYETHPGSRELLDMYYMLSELVKYHDGGKDLVEYFAWLAEESRKVLYLPSSREEFRGAYEFYEKVLWLASPWHFDSYCRFLEWRRDPEKRFYEPREDVLKGVADLLQKLADGELKVVCISMPPGTGKTTLAIFYLTWMAGKYPEEPMLTGSHSNSFVRGVYDECLRILDADGEYRWHDVFPTVRLIKTNAKDCRIDLTENGVRGKRFETLEFTSVGSGNAGLYRARRLLYCDDLVPGIEVALSKERLDKLWELYSTDLRQRKMGDHCGELHIATRWSLYDVIGRLENLYEGDPGFAELVLPAVDEAGESNFDYKYGVGFSTEFYREQKEAMDEASWDALYMNKPIEREGRLYHPDELRRYFTLPDREPDAILAACDTKDKGKDYCVLPVGYRYGNDIYIEEVVCDNGKPEIVDVRLAETLLRHKVHMARFESNAAGGRVAQIVQEKIKAKGGRTAITTKFSSANKETRIIMASPYVKEHFLFKDDSVITDQDYRRFMNMLCTYSMAGKNTHDDAPDGIGMLADYIQSLSGGGVEVFQRPF